MLRDKIDSMNKDSYKLYLKWHIETCECPEKLMATNHFLFQCSKKDLKIFSYNDEIVKNEIEKFSNFNVEFSDFEHIEEIFDDDLSIKIREYKPAKPEKNYVPAYEFDILLNGENIGEISLRIGYNTGLYYGGNIGYGICEKYRGKGYAVRACKLISSVAKKHKMRYLCITNEYKNYSSKRVCEKLGADFIRIVSLPEDNEMRSEGVEYNNIFFWEI